MDTDVTVIAGARGWGGDRREALSMMFRKNTGWEEILSRAFLSMYFQIIVGNFYCWIISVTRKTLVAHITSRIKGKVS